MLAGRRGNDRKIPARRAQVFMVTVPAWTANQGRAGRRCDERKEHVPIHSMCASGLSVTRPGSRRPLNPERSAVHACAASCTESDRINNRRNRMSAREVWQREKTISRGDGTQDRVGGFARRPREARPAGTEDARNDPNAVSVVCDGAARRRRCRRVGSKVALCARLPMKGNGESVRFVTECAAAAEGRRVARQRETLGTVAREDQLSSFARPMATSRSSPTSGSPAYLR